MVLIQTTFLAASHFYFSSLKLDRCLLIACSICCKPSADSACFLSSVQRGDAVTARDEIVCPEDWEWTTDWTVDLNRAVDEDGTI